MIIRMFAAMGWGGITALGLVLLGANAYWIAQEAKIPTGTATILVWQWLSVLASLILVSVIAGYLANARSIGIFIDERNRISLSRVQWLAWFLVLFSGYFTGAVWDVAFGGDLPAIETTLFGVIGITTGSAVVSNMVVDAKKQETAAPVLMGGPPLVGRIDVNASSNDAAWADLYLGEEQGNRFSVDPSRLQKLIVTMLLVIVYVEMLWTAFTQASLSYSSFAMPVVGTNFVALMGSSHAAYLAYKATNKTPT
jgi:hypothetical protein